MTLAARRGASPTRRRARLLRGPLGVVGLVAAVVVAAVLLRAFVAEAYFIPSASMEPTLHIHDRVVVSRVAYDLHPPRRGDIVVFDAPPGIEPAATGPGSIVARGLHDVGRALGLVDDQSVLIKRVIALPGEIIEGRNGRVLVDGRILVEPYLAPGTLTSDFGPYRIPPGTLWVMGDNRGDSEDSRVFGAVRERTVVGRAVWRVWPPGRLSFLTLPARAVWRGVSADGDARSYHVVMRTPVAPTEGLSR